jgi:DNA helicase-2/ATP-dependent DNA helicase PcrA
MRGTEKPIRVLASLKENIRKLADLMSGNASILEVLRFVDCVRLIRLDERLKAYVSPDTAANSLAEAKSFSPEQVEDGTDEDKEGDKMVAYLACPVSQVQGYYTYIRDESPYSTQQGIKGAEFERVLVVLDDGEGRHFQFSYDKLLGLKPPSRTDVENKNQNRETVQDRTRRLFYVCCSRAKKDLAVVLYATDVEDALAHLTKAEIFRPADIHTLKDISY